MTEIRLSVDDKFLDSLKDASGYSKVSAITNEALILLKWAIDETKKGRIVISANEDLEDIQKIVMPILENAKAQEQTTA